MKSKKLVPITLALLTILSLTVVLSPVVAADPATGSISATFKSNGASTLTLPNDSIGEQVIVELKITGASNVWSWKTDLEWNNNVLHLSEVNPGSELVPGVYAELFLATSPSGSTLFFGQDSSTWKVNVDAVGYVSGGISSTRTTATATTNTQGVLATLIFDVVGYGEADITLSNGKVVNTSNEATSISVTGASLTVPSSSTIYSLTILSEHGSPSPAGTIWYVSGTSVDCIPGLDSTPGITYTCTGWTGTGSVPATGDSTTASFIISADSTITWEWITGTSTPTPSPTATPTPTPSPTPSGDSKTLTVISEHGNPIPSIGSNTFNSGENVTCNMPATTVVVNGVTYNTVVDGGVTYACTGWTGTGSVPATGSGTTANFILAADSTITWNWILLPASIDVWTDKGGNDWGTNCSAYGPEEEVLLSAKVTSEGGVPKANQQVVFTLTYANGKSFVLSSNTSGQDGIATASSRLEWPSTNPTNSFGIVNITAKATITPGSTVIDTCYFMYNYLLQTTSVEITNSAGHISATNGPYFSRYTGPAVTASVTVRNINWDNPTSFYLVATIFDNNNVPIAYASLPQTINPATSGTPSNSNSQTYTVTINLPTYAYVGPAKLYINVYTDNPINMGVPFCPETSANLVIEATT